MPHVIHAARDSASILGRDAMEARKAKKQTACLPSIKFQLGAKEAALSHSRELAPSTSSDAMNACTYALEETMSTPKPEERHSFLAGPSVCPSV